MTTGTTSNVFANAGIHHDTENENIYHEINDVASASVIATNGASQLEVGAGANQTQENNPAEVKDNLYLTLVEHLYANLPSWNDRESATSHARKRRKVIIISISIALISTLAILAAVSVLLLELHTTAPDIITSVSPTTASNISTPITITTAYIADVDDCSKVYKAGKNDSGVYNITLQGQTVPVYCDMQNGGGWTVFHNRLDGSVDFYRYWSEYKAGFGDLEGEFWWGNDHLATLTAAKQYKLRVDLSDWDGDTAYALYTNFRVAAETDNYRLTAKGYNGTAGGDGFVHESDGRAFSTRDRDNDDNRHTHCSKQQHAGGWFRDTLPFSNPNGRYGRRGYDSWDAMYWFDWKALKSLQTMSLKFRPTDF